MSQNYLVIIFLCKTQNFKKIYVLYYLSLQCGFSTFSGIKTKTKNNPLAPIIQLQLILSNN